jgi:hypothetical protein
MTDITRHNWRSHCQEPRLSADEWQRWEAVAERIRSDRDFADAVLEATEAEWQAEQAAGKLDGWAGLARWADAARRHRRAVIAAGERLT